MIDDVSGYHRNPVKGHISRPFINLREIQSFGHLNTEFAKLSFTKPTYVYSYCTA